MEMSIQRSAYLQTIRQRLADNPVVSLLGPRQAGKTTLARLLAADWPEAVHVFDLESPADLAKPCALRATDLRGPRSPRTA